MEILKSTIRNVEKFNQIYADDRFRARIFAFENTPSIEVVSYNNVSPGVFQIFNDTKTFGVSKTMKLYVRRKNNYKYIVNKTKFYKHQGAKMIPVTLDSVEKEYRPIFIKHFSWIRFLEEFSIRGISFNAIVRNRLYSRDKCLRYMFGCSAETALNLMSHLEYKEWKVLRKNIVNTENFNPDLLQNKPMFIDSVALAYKLNQSVNAAWSFRRLKEEHDKWSKEYTDIAFELTSRELLIHPIFFSFNDYLGGGLITTTKGLAIEGRTQRHCVASYSHQVDSGKSGIFNVNGYTAEIVNTGMSLRLVQFKGHRNAEVPHLEIEALKNRIERFNETKKQIDFKFVANRRIEVIDEVDLPF